MVQTVKFDPGMGEYVYDFNNFVNEVYSQVMSFKTIHQKRARFKLFSAKIDKYLKNNIAFYLGCLLWAYILYFENIKTPKEIVGNYFLNMSEEMKENFDYKIQVNFIENYFDSYERDMMYYTGKKVVIPNEWREIISLYSEFLDLNNGFFATKNTSDIVLPQKLLNKTFSEDIKSIIQLAIESKDLEVILKSVKIGE